MASEKEAIEELRTKVVRALDIVPSPRLIRLMADAGYPLTIDNPALRRFANGESTNSTNAEAISGYLNGTDLGKALSGMPLTQESRGAFMQGLDLPPGPWPYPTPLVGRYYVYHGSHLFTDKFVIRALEIRAAGASRLDVDDWMRDNRTVTDKIHKAPGMALIFKTWAQIVTFHQDNSFGIRMMNLTDTNEDDGSMHGHITGLTKAGQVFRRAVRLRRSSRLSLTAMIPQTGIYPQSELLAGNWRRHAREFEFMSTRQADWNADDPLNDVWKTRPELLTDKELNPELAAGPTPEKATK